MSNKDVEEQCIKIVIDYEKKQGRIAQRIPQGKGYDVESTGRQIEVKGHKGNKPPFALLNGNNIKGLQKAENWFLYIVYNLTDNPKIIILTKAETLSKVIPSMIWEVPLRKINYDNAKSV